MAFVSFFESKEQIWGQCAFTSKAKL